MTKSKRIAMLEADNKAIIERVNVLTGDVEALRLEISRLKSMLLLTEPSEDDEKPSAEDPNKKRIKEMMAMSMFSAQHRFRPDEDYKK